MNQYKRKQFTIAVVFVFIVVAIGLAVYFLFFQSQATCFDNIQNQGEQGIDCGGPCGLCEEPEDLIVISKNFILTTEFNSDLVAEIKNPNNNWGAESLVYVFDIYSGNELIGSKQGKTYFLPQETKHIIEQRFFSDQTPTRIELKLREINWQKLKDFRELEIKIKNSGIRLTENNFTQIFGNVENRSNFDLDKIEINAVLLYNDRIVAAGKSEMSTILMGESRYFEINWPFEVLSDNFELKAYTNIYLNENFLKTHGTQERFKEY